MEWVVSWSYQEVVGVWKTYVKVGRGGEDVGRLRELEGSVGVERQWLVSRMKEILWDEKGADLAVVG